MNTENPHETLGLSPDAPEVVIDAAYRSLVKEYHPDHGGSAEEFAEIKQAYDSIKSGDANDVGEQRGSPSWFGNSSFWETTPAETISAIGDPQTGLTVKGEVFTARLLGIISEVDVSNIVHRSIEVSDAGVDASSDLKGGNERTLVLFLLHNKTNDVQTWHRDESKYIDTTGFAYQREDRTIDSENLGPRWISFYVDLEPKSKTYFLAIVEQMPSNTKLGRIVQTVDIHEEGRTSGWVQGQERYEFVIDDLDEQLISLPEN
jgi:curved DNA-binding protein CbpA